VFADLPEFHRWMDDQRTANDYRVEQVPLAELDGWYVEDASGNLRHRSGRFYSVQGLAVETDHRATRSWTQPIIVQDEIGILGILVAVVAGRVHCLMQAKMEPGNINVLQLSPTVQATRSNYSRVHQGAAVPYLEHFVAPRRGRIVFDALQSEQGSWFLRKRNRNMIVEVDEPFDPEPGFCWLRLDQLAGLMAVPNLVNMDSRTVLSGLPALFSQDIDADAGAPVHRDAELLSWFTEIKSTYRIDRELIPLRDVAGWDRTDVDVRHREGKHFTVVGVDVAASNREVARWSQPMLRPVGRGVIAFLGRRIRGRFHVLAHARTEAGTLDVVEIAPTVNCIPENYADAGPEARPPFLDACRDAPPERVLVDVVHSEEGGRFLHAENRYLVIDVGPEFPLDVPADYCWMTPGQLVDLTRYGNHVNVAARCLLSCLIGQIAPMAVAA
jgi:dTDP-4-dehydro-6-deoxy-alpha-D-glucopyranose 2,3-dehydratase